MKKNWRYYFMMWKGKQLLQTGENSFALELTLVAYTESKVHSTAQVTTGYQYFAREKDSEVYSDGLNTAGLWPYYERNAGIQIVTKKESGWDYMIVSGRTYMHLN